MQHLDEGVAVGETVRRLGCAEVKPGDFAPGQRIHRDHRLGGKASGGGRLIKRFAGGANHLALVGTVMWCWLLQDGCHVVS